jgi:endonuclease YncB( thermonuclease family)
VNQSANHPAGRGHAGRASIALSATAVVLTLGLVLALAPWPITVVDGDTVDRMWSRHRLVGYDAPEIRRAKCAGERERGMTGKVRLAELIASAQRLDLVKVKSAGRDPYGRVLSRLEVDGIDVATIAIREGWGAPYSGRGIRRDWCAE